MVASFEKKHNSLFARLVHGNFIPVGIPWEASHGMGWDRHKLLCDGNGTDKYVPWTTLLFAFNAILTSSICYFYREWLNQIWSRIEIPTNQMFFTRLRQYCGSVKTDVVELDRQVLNGTLHEPSKQFPCEHQMSCGRQQRATVDHVTKKKTVFRIRRQIC